MDRLEEMGLFIASVDGGSLSAGARSVGVTPSAASRALSRLEERLGATLVERSTRTLTLTEAGAGYLEDCRRLLEDVQEAERRAAQADAGVRGTVHLRAPLAALQMGLADRLADFQQAHPDVLLSVQTDTDSDSSERVDLTVLLLPEGQEPPLGAVRLQTLPTRLYASTRYLARNDDPWFAEDLPGHRWVLLLRGGVPQRQPGLPTIHAARIRLRTPCLLAMHQAVRSGIGIGLLPSPLAQPDVDAGLLKPVLESLQGVPWVMWALITPRRFIPARTSALAELLTRQG